MNFVHSYTQDNTRLLLFPNVDKVKSVKTLYTENPLLKTISISWNQRYNYKTENILKLYFSLDVYARVESQLVEIVHDSALN